MTIQGIARAHREVAIFARNHMNLMDEALEISTRGARGLIVFRARSKWVSASHALAARRPRDLYVAPIGESGMVEYMADLQDIMLKPERGQPRTEELLSLTLTSTRQEGLWEKDHAPQVNTLYAISNCRRIPHPFPMTDLVKIADGKPISEDYGYSYSLVHPYIFEREQ